MPGPRRSQRPPDFPDGDGSDWISDRPDEMLLQILVRLRCARAAAHTSSLSRRWRGLWRHLPELSFRDISADALNAALDQVACPALSFLEVDILQKHRVMDPVRVSALLHAAARLAPADLVFRLWGHCKDGNIPIEIPCFERATSVKLLMVGLYLIPPAGGVEFPLLERLSVTGCRFDTEELVHRCPRLRVFEVSQWFYGTTVVKVHSSTIEELVVEGNPSNIDIMAPVLKRFSLWVSTAEDFTLSFSAPMVENISWYCSPMVENSGFGEIWRLGDLKLEMKENVGVLRMRITISVGFPANRQKFQDDASTSAAPAHGATAATPTPAPRASAPLAHGATAATPPPAPRASAPRAHRASTLAASAPPAQRASTPAASAPTAQRASVAIPSAPGPRPFSAPRSAVVSDGGTSSAPRRASSRTPKITGRMKGYLNAGKASSYKK
ncbi:hypothetical protein ACQ4PT_002657 [Festuca glaucescens]